MCTMQIGHKTNNYYDARLDHNQWTGTVNAHVQWSQKFKIRYMSPIHACTCTGTVHFYRSSSHPYRWPMQEF